MAAPHITVAVYDNMVCVGLVDCIQSLCNEFAPFMNAIFHQVYVWFVAFFWRIYIPPTTSLDSAKAMSHSLHPTQPNQLIRIQYISHFMFRKFYVQEFVNFGSSLPTSEHACHATVFRFTNFRKRMPEVS